MRQPFRKLGQARTEVLAGFEAQDIPAARDVREAMPDISCTVLLGDLARKSVAAAHHLGEIVGQREDAARLARSHVEDLPCAAPGLQREPAGLGDIGYMHEVPLLAAV